jgi:hypothetical protein
MKGRSGNYFSVKMTSISFNFRRTLKWLVALVLWLVVWLRMNTVGSHKIAFC